MNSGCRDTVCNLVTVWSLYPSLHHLHVCWCRLYSISNSDNSFCDEARCSGVSLTDSYLVEELRYRDQIVTRLHTVMGVCLCVHYLCCTVLAHHALFQISELVSYTFSTLIFFIYLSILCTWVCFVMIDTCLLSSNLCVGISVIVVFRISEKVLWGQELPTDCELME